MNSQSIVDHSKGTVFAEELDCVVFYYNGKGLLFPFQTFDV